jgi:hypothetical protein
MRRSAIHKIPISGFQDRDNSRGQPLGATAQIWSHESCKIACGGIKVISEPLITEGTGPELLLGAPTVRKEKDFVANRFKVDCRKYPSDKACTVTISGALEEVVELGWLHAKMHHAHKDEEEKGIKDWIRSNAEAAND